MIDGDELAELRGLLIGAERLVELIDGVPLEDRDVAAEEDLAALLADLTFVHVATFVDHEETVQRYGQPHRVHYSMRLEA